MNVKIKKQYRATKKAKNNVKFIHIIENVYVK